MDHLPKLAELIRTRSAIDGEIAKILNRPVHSGHFGEFIASAVLDIQPSSAANEKVYDGRFRSGPLIGRTVNVKYRTIHRRLLNLATSTDPNDHPDFYLALVGPSMPMGSTVGTHAPLCVEAVYLFESPQLLLALAARGVRPGTGRSVPSSLWNEAMIYPDARNPRLLLTQGQRDALALFASPEQ